MRLAKLIREYLWATKTSQRAFGEKIGWPTHTVNRFVTGRSIDGTNLATLLRWLLEEETIPPAAAIDANLGDPSNGEPRGIAEDHNSDSGQGNTPSVEG